MTTTDQILIAANKLANAGQKPSVALVKAKLKQSIPLPLLIKTLKTWQHQPEFISMKNEFDEVTSRAIDETAEQLRENNAVKALIQETLATELKQMKTELQEMKKLIVELSEQLKESNKK